MAWSVALQIGKNKNYSSDGPSSYLLMMVVCRTDTLEVFFFYNIYVIPCTFWHYVHRNTQPRFKVFWNPMRTQIHNLSCVSLAVVLLSNFSVKIWLWFPSCHQLSCVKGRVLHCTELCSVLNWTELYCIVLYCPTLHWTKLHCTTLHVTSLHYNEYYSALNCTDMYCIALHCTSL